VNAIRINGQSYLRGPDALSVIRQRLPVPLGRSTLYRYLETAEIANLKVGGQWFVPVAQVTELVEPFVNKPGPWLSVPTARRIFTKRSGVPMSRTGFDRYLKRSGVVVQVHGFWGRRYVSWPALEQLLKEAKEQVPVKKLITVLALMLLACLPVRAQHSVTLTWAAGSCGTTPASGGYIDCNGNMMICNHVTGYRVYRSADAGGMPGLFSLLASTNGPLTYTDTTVAANDMWWYAVTVMVDSPCESAYSNEIWVRIPPSVGDVMYFSASKWVPKTPATPIAIQSTPLGTPPKAGDVLMWFSSKWMARTPVSPIRGGKTTTGQVLVWNGTAWAPKTPTTPVKKK
jgi:hypothetical protein